MERLQLRRPTKSGTKETGAVVIQSGIHAFVTAPRTVRRLGLYCEAANFYPRGRHSGGRAPISGRLKTSPTTDRTAMGVFAEGGRRGAEVTTGCRSGRWWDLEVFGMHVVTRGVDMAWSSRILYIALAPESIRRRCTDQSFTHPQVAAWLTLSVAQHHHMSSSS